MWLFKVVFYPNTEQGEHRAGNEAQKVFKELIKVAHQIWRYRDWKTPNLIRFIRD